ncbi:M20/M25/M40 family metallo-hydrolase [Sphingomonas sp. G124]|uniref:M20/M25/M40 family metallo-hydrolase n=1 Tax=Sphingomonas cremea TaxID=2904799 RepID=A0A9X1QPE8_9SPHN|nr:M20/M25/M40 family metallo-hydrolase [Sphingomonas cremea]MCF2515762.1 M20/M25/M40 family metallo-hydrolase [Sphingomonas cremea]
MDFDRLQAFIEQIWVTEVMPSLLSYIEIPCESPAFDCDWEGTGHIDRAVELMAGWARRSLCGTPGAVVDVLRIPRRTPVIFIDVPGDGRSPVLIYGHLDKQPPMDGWVNGRGAWTPVIEGDRLYGRGGADDGYSLFGAIAGLLALREQGLAHPPCRILIEACEESGSFDLPFYFEALAERIGEPGLIIALDASCGNYDQLWVTTSLRGQVAGTLTIRVLSEGMHSGEASGLVPSPFRIARGLLSRVEDPDSGEVVVPDFQVQIPADRRTQAKQSGDILGTAIFSQLPLHDGLQPVNSDPVELSLNRSWRPQLAITGMDGLPEVSQAAAVMHPDISLKLSLRLPPTLDPRSAAATLKALLEENPPYNAKVQFRVDFVSPGWHAPALADWLQTALDEASERAFGRPSALMGGGGGIPFLSMLGERFPAAQFVATGVLGPQSNAHGPNEFLHLPTAERIVAAVACLLHNRE